MNGAFVVVSVLAAVVSTICLSSSGALVSLVLVLAGCAISWGARGLVAASWLCCALVFGADIHHRSRAEDRARASDAWFECLRSLPPSAPTCFGDGGCAPSIVAQDTSACDAVRDRMIDEGQVW
jgi:hypothetical protein